MLAQKLGHNMSDRKGPHQRLVVLDQTHGPGGLLIVWQLLGHRREDGTVVPLGHRIMGGEKSLRNNEDVLISSSILRLILSFRTWRWGCLSRQQSSLASSEQLCSVLTSTSSCSQTHVEGRTRTSATTGERAPPGRAPPWRCSAQAPESPAGTSGDTRTPGKHKVKRSTPTSWTQTKNL